MTRVRGLGVRIAGVWVALSLLVPAGPAGAQDEARAVLGELAQLRLQVASLESVLRQRAQALEETQREIHSVGQEVGGLKERVTQVLQAPLLASSFLAAPPAASDSLGVAKTAVFEPRVEVESVRRHDTLFLKLRRIEIGAVKPIGELELAANDMSLDLPIDQNGGLYALEWSTTEGYSYNLVLRDGASGQPVATVPVKPLQNEGRILFVGYRIE